ERKQDEAQRLMTQAMGSLNSRETGDPTREKGAIHEKEHPHSNPAGCWWFRPTDRRSSVTESGSFHECVPGIGHRVAANMAGSCSSAVVGSWNVSQSVRILSQSCKASPWEAKNSRICAESHLRMSSRM